ncbi:hypothetical protein [Daejeonia sp. YH14]|uniref:hypothetical protein n=1 Tax=Daejeonia sp. YH14 TaxID=3439042 RepID=UPI003F497081
MKRMTAALLLISFMGVFAQNVSDYQYIHVPKKFDDFKTNNAYNLNKILTLKLQDKNYTVLSDDRENWPAEVLANPCSLLNGEVENDSSFLRNKLILKFTDCNDKAVAEIKSTSMYKEYDKGFQDALVTAILKVPVSSPKALDASIPPAGQVSELQKTAPKTDEKTETAIASSKNEEKSVVKTSNQAAASQAEVYSYNGQTLQRINLGNDQFILTSSGSSVPFATFRASTQKDTYRVTLQNGSMTLGYLENGNLVIENQDAAGNLKKEVFVRK